MAGVMFDKKIYEVRPGIRKSMRDLLDIGVDLGASVVERGSGVPPRYRMGPDLLKYEEAAELKDSRGHEPMSPVDPETAKRLIYSMFTTRKQLDRFKREQEFDLSAETEKARFRVNVGVESRGPYSTIRIIPYRGCVAISKSINTSFSSII